METNTTTLYRPIGQKEYELIQATNSRRFPPRLPSQPIFYPVLREDYAIQIARDWNTKDPVSGFVGYVVRFRVENSFLVNYEVHKVGAQQKHLEYWIPADELEKFNDHIVGAIEVVHVFR